jgi:hypothetical protein
MADATRRGGKVVNGWVSAVRPVELRPLGLIPSGSAEGRPSAAGNTAYWSGVEVDVTDGTSTVTVPIPLIAGGADVIEATNLTTSPESFKALTGSCALAVTGTAGTPAALGGPRLVAVSATTASSPVAFDPQMKAVVESAPSLAELASR